DPHPFGSVLADEAEESPSPQRKPKPGREIAIDSPGKFVVREVADLVVWVGEQAAARAHAREPFDPRTGSAHRLFRCGHRRPQRERVETRRARLDGRSARDSLRLPQHPLLSTNTPCITPSFDPKLAHD